MDSVSQSLSVTFVFQLAERHAYSAVPPAELQKPLMWERVQIHSALETLHVKEQRHTLCCLWPPCPTRGTVLRVPCEGRGPLDVLGPLRPIC